MRRSIFSETQIELDSKSKKLKWKRVQTLESKIKSGLFQESMSLFLCVCFDVMEVCVVIMFLSLLFLINFDLVGKFIQ